MLAEGSTLSPEQGYMQYENSWRAGVVAKLALKGVGGFALSPNQDAPSLAAVVPEAKGCPGFAGVWPLAALSKSGEPPAPVARRSFFRVGAAMQIPASVLCRLQGHASFSLHISPCMHILQLLPVSTRWYVA